ncbi:short-chain dehydrogenase/reductase [Apiospora arundinis]
MPGDTYNFARTLFDRYGRVQRKYTEPGFRQGSGAWGHELDYGNILFFAHASYTVGGSDLNADMELVIKALLDKARELIAQGRFIALVDSKSIDQDSVDEYRASETRELEDYRQFWRSLGFRRIGTSRPEHDYNLWFALLKDAEDPYWRATEPGGNTVLYLAALERQPEIIKFILSRRPDLAATHNRDGDTPLEALLSDMERLRTTGANEFVGQSDRFRMFRPHAATDAVGALSGIKTFDCSQLTRKQICDISSSSDEQARVLHPDADAIRYTLRVNYGCTCGQCTGGFLSPRMKMDDEDWFEEGAVTLCEHFVQCLEQAVIPNKVNLVSSGRWAEDEGESGLCRYLKQGGTVGEVVKRIFEGARDGDEWSGTGDNKLEYGSELDELAECRNDHEYSIVHLMCGYYDIYY